MNVVLSPELEKLIKESIARGDFASRDDFFSQAAQLLLARRNAEPVPVDEHWDSRIDTLLEEAEASGDATEMSEHDWLEVERQGLTLIQQRKRA